MSRLYSLRGLALALGVTGLANSCTAPYNDLVAPTAARGGMFNSYVAIGNSITAGYQSGGLTESIQRTSYAAKLASSMGTRFAIPAMAAPGCAPPITSFTTQARPAGTTAATCALRTAASLSDAINNVAVPGATSLDPTSSSTTASNALTGFILGGKTQVQKALEANPTFVSIWIGNNDVLGPAISSLGTTASLATMNDSLTFATNYTKIIDTLKAHRPGIKGVLIGVTDVTNIPLMFRASALPAPGASNAFKAGFDAIACSGNPPAGSAFAGCFGAPGGTTVLASCTGSTSIVNTMLAFAIRQGQHPAIISCASGGGIGDAFVLDATEQATVSARVAAYNGYISKRATDEGFAYWNPNNATDGLPSIKSDTTGTLIRITPSPTTGTNPFGAGMSLDGVHPGNTLHGMIANAVIAQINAKYGTALPKAF